MYPHRIRLRGPWEYEPVSGPEPLPAPGRMTMPCRWKDGGLPGFAGTVRFRRHFGYPGRLDAFERVWLTFAGLTGIAHIRLNGQNLGVLTAAGEFEITSLLQNRNILEVDVEGQENAGLWGDVALEIRCAAFLRDLRASRASSTAIHLTGEVAGVCEEKLELYVLMNRANVGYAIVQPGQPFDLTIGLPRGSLPSLLRVELVCVATVWFAAEIPLPC